MALGSHTVQHLKQEAAGRVGGLPWGLCFHTVFLRGVFTVGNPQQEVLSPLGK